MTTPQKISTVVGAILVTTLAIFLAVKPAAPIVFSCVSSSSNLISVQLSNQSSSTIVYFIGSPILKSNGVWGTFLRTNRTRLSQLGAGRSVTRVITVLPESPDIKVPVLWGFAYSPSGPRWRQVGEDAAAYFRMHDFRGRGALYTNYAPNTKP
jgi:hypothetical protein